MKKKKIIISSFVTEPKLGKESFCELFNSALLAIY